METELKMIIGVLGNLSEEEIVRLPEVSKALAKGATIGAYVLQNGDVLENGVGIWV